MKHPLSELIDLAELQHLMDAMHRATGINHALLDIENKVLTASGWQKCCTDFHRINPQSCAHCHASDQFIFSHLSDGAYIGYECLNGLFDYAVPVRIDGEHVATMFTGQVLHASPDMARFRQQAEKFGFDESAYLASIREVNIIPPERMADVMAFLVGLAQMLGRRGAARLEHEAKMEQEKKRVAREMHDELGQLLTAQAMNVALLDLQFGDGTPELREKTREMAALVEKTIDAVRHLATSLRPAALELGLLAALEWLADDFNRRSRTRCRVDAPGGDIVLDDATATALFRIVQESLTNVMRHAKAGTVLISLRQNGTTLRLQIQDNGRGFDTAAARDGHGFGLQGMRERGIALGAALIVDSTPGNGTCVSLDLPCSAEQKT